jgi:hypothetical protein
MIETYLTNGNFWRQLGIVVDIAALINSVIAATLLFVKGNNCAAWWAIIAGIWILNALLTDIYERGK